MTRDRHATYGVPSSARYTRHAYREPVRTDPGYAEHRPLERADLGDWRLWVEAVVMFVAIVMFALLASLIPVPGV